MPAEVKICGLSTTETLDAALDAGADYVGLVFFPASPRHVDRDTARRLAERARGRARVVALTVDAPDALIDEIVEAVRPDYIQAHGAESPDRLAAIGARAKSRLIKAVKVREPADLTKSSAYRNAADIVLFDAKAPEELVGALPGGNGVSFDWRMLAGRDLGRYMLSGGLGVDTVEEAIRVTRAPIVDVSSGVETAPGRKDPALIRKFIEAVRRAG